MNLTISMQLPIPYNAASWFVAFNMVGLGFVFPPDLSRDADAVRVPCYFSPLTW